MAFQFTPVELGRVAGFNANLATRGRMMTTNTGETITVLVQNGAMLPDPNKPAQEELPVYAVITCLAGALANPREVTVFTEGNQTHKVMSYNESSGDRVTWKFEVESQRQTFPI